MTFPNPAMRADWYATNNEAGAGPDDPTDDEQGGLPAAWAASRSDTQTRTQEQQP